MFNTYKMQLHKISRQKSFVFSFLFIFALCLYNYVRNLIFYQGFDVSYIPHPSGLFSLSTTSYTVNYLVRFFPFLLVMPAAFTFMSDRQTKTINLIQSRCGAKRYYFSLILAVFTMTFLCFFIPFILELLLSMIAFPLSAKAIEAGEVYFSEAWVNRVNNYLYQPILAVSRIAYSVFYAFLFSATAAILGLLVSALSTFRVQFKVMLFLPIYLFLFFLDNLGERLSISMNTKYYHYIFAYDPTTMAGTRSPLIFHISLLILLFIGLTIFYLRSREDTLI